VFVEPLEDLPREVEPGKSGAFALDEADNPKALLVVLKPAVAPHALI
jgi:hypothetical protein